MAPDALRQYTAKPNLWAVVGGTVALIAAWFLRDVLVLVFASVLLAASPRTYVGGVIALVPKRYERRVRLLMGELGSTLWWWSLGRLISMTFVGVTTGVGLALLGIPLAFLLGLLVGLAGVALAAPLTAAAMVVVSVLWVQGVLGKPGIPSRRTTQR